MSASNFKQREHKRIRELEAELARVSREHETMRDALAEARKHLGPHAKAKLDAALAGSRAATPKCRCVYPDKCFCNQLGAATPEDA